MPVPSGEPTTVYTGRGGEYSSTGVLTLADASGVLLADASGTNLVDSGIVFTQTPPTVYTANDGA